MVTAETVTRVPWVAVVDITFALSRGLSAFLSGCGQCIRRLRIQTTDAPLQIIYSHRLSLAMDDSSSAYWQLSALLQ